MSNYWKKKLDELNEQNANTPSKETNSSNYWDKKMAELEKTTEKNDDDIAPVKTEEKNEKEKGDFWGWLGDTAMSGLAQFNKSLTSTADVILGKPLQALGWEDNPISSVAKFYENDYNYYKSKSMEESAKMGGGGWSVAEEIVQGTVAAVPDAVAALMTMGTSLAPSATNLATQATYRAGDLLTKAGLTASKMAKNPQFWLSFTKTYGSDYEEAIEGGANEAVASFTSTITSLINAGIEIGIDGGSGFQGLPDKIKNGDKSAIKAWVESALEEGGEEVLQGFVNDAVAKVSYDPNRELIDPEEKLKEFGMGAAVGGILGGGQVAVQSGINAGVNAVQKAEAKKLTETEQAVVDKVYKDEIAEREKDGKKLTQREKSKIYDEVLEQMEKGYISTDTIEEVLGGKTFEAYKSAVEKENALQGEFDALNKMKQGEMTGEQLDRRAELKEELAKLKENSDKDFLKTKLAEDSFELVKDSRLAESYNEKSRRGQAFEADLSQYDEKYQGTIKKAVESGILNNTRRAHEMVDFISKISADKGVLFDFTDNEKLKNSSYAVKGKTVNGFVDENGSVVLNINSAKSLNSTAGHEITHILEGTELYQPLSDIITEYAKTKGEYDSRLEALNKLYEGVYKGEDFNEKVNKELVADLVGDYIFTDKAFVQKLSTENRNVFQKIYDEIKYLCKVATAGSKEARELEKVKKTFAEVYRENGKTESKGDKKYSLSDSEGTQLSKEQQDFFKDSKMRDDNGNLKVMYHGSQDAGFHIFDAKMSDDDTSFFFVDRNDVAASYSGTTETYEARTIRTAEDMNNFLASIGYDDYQAIEKDGKFELLENNEHVAYSDTAQGLYEEFCWYEGVGEGDANYKVYLNLKNPLIVDGKGRPWNKIDAEFSQEVYDRYNSLTAEERAALVDLAEWEDFRLFNSEIQEAQGNELASAYAKMGEDCNIYDLFSVAADNFSEDSMKENARHYLNTREFAKRAKEQGYDGVIFNNIHDNGGYSNGSEGASTVAIAFESNQIKSVANDKPTGNADIRYSISGVNAKTANSSMLLRAEHLLNTGADSEAVRQETGWYKGYDGKMRFEIDDSKSELIEKPNLEKKQTEDGDTYFTGKLSDILNHSELYEAYPQLRNVNIVIQPTEIGTRGIYQPNSNYITLSLELFKRHTKEYADWLEGSTEEVKRIEQTPEYKEYSRWFEDEELSEKLSAEEWLEGEKKAQDKFFSSELGKRYYYLKWGHTNIQKTEFGWGKEAKAVLMHEIQHAIQKIENFASGSTPTYWQHKLNAGYTIKTAEQKAKLEEAEEKYFEIFKQNPAFYNEMNSLLFTAPDMPRGQVDWETLEQIEEDPIEWQEFDKKRDALEEKYGTLEVFDFIDLYHELKQLNSESMNADDAYYNTAGEIEARDTANRLNLNAEQRKAKRPDIDNKRVVFADARYSLSETDHKQKQLDIILETNPAYSDSFTWIREVEDIHTLEETLSLSDWTEYDEFDPDLTKADILKAIESGKITVYSSHPIENGAFVTPSRMEAETYAGTGKVYQKTVDINNVAWIDPTQGQYAEVNSSYSLSEQDEAPTKHGNFNIYGEDVKLETEPTVEDIAPVMESTPVTEEEAIAHASEDFPSLSDEDAPPEVEAPYTEYSDTTRLDDETLKNISKSLTDVLYLNRKEAKAIRDIVQQYSTTEFPSKSELFWTIKEQFGEKYFEDIVPDVEEVRDYLKNYKVSVSDTIKGDIADYNSLRKSLFNKVKVVKDGTAVDSAYQELSEMFPSFFPEDITNPTDQFLKIAEVADMSKTTTESYKLDDETIQAAVDIITDEVTSYKEISAKMDAEDLARESLEDIAPMKAKQIVDNANSQNDTLQQPIETVEYRQAKKLKALETELEENKRLRSEAIADYSNRISRLNDEYGALKDKNSRKGNEMLQRFLRYERLKSNVDADYSKRISDLEARIAEMKQNVKTDRVASVTVEEPTVEKKKSNGWNTAVRNLVDKGAEVEKVALKHKNRELQAKYNFLHYTDGIAQRLIGKGTKGVKALKDIQKRVNHLGKNQNFDNKFKCEIVEKSLKEDPKLAKAVNENPEKMSELLFETYMYHKLNVDRMTLEDRYDDVDNKSVFGDYVSAEKSDMIAHQYELAYPEFVDLAVDVYDYTNYLRDTLVEKGVISQDTADLWAEMYPHYVPIRRVGESGVNINVALDTNKTGVNAPIKRATGGNSKILPLFDTIGMRTMQTFKAAAKNSFGVELKNTLGTTIETAETDLDGIIDSVDSHESLLQEGKDGMPPTFTVFENGERVTFEITEEMYEALKPTSKGLAHTYKLPNAISNLQRNILTQYNPTFMLTNAFKDAQDVLLNSQHPARTYANFPRAIIEMIGGKGKYYNEYIENGGEQNTYFEKDSNTFTKEKSTLRKVVGFPLDAIAKANNFIERIPRLAEYIASRQKGASVEVAMLDSARVTTNFAAGGDVTKFANRNGATFLNASVQGAYQQVRNIREAKANGLKGWLGLATKTIIAGLPAILLNGLLWEDDEEYEELSDYVKDNYYVVAKTEDGKFIRIPKGRAVAVIQDAYEQMGNAITGDDEVDWRNFLNLLKTNVAPNNPIDNNILSPILQVASNTAWYGEDLVPTRLQDVPEAEQYDESTDSISKWLGENLNYSPMKINYLLNQYSGGVGDVFLPMGTPEAESGDNSFGGNLIAPLKDKFTTDSVMNNQNVSDFYDKVDELTVNANSSRATDEDILKSKYINSVSSDLGELYQQKREIQNSMLSDDVKYERVRDIQEQINSLARNSLNSYDSVNIQGKYATVGNQHFRWYEPGEDSTAEAGWQKVSGKQLEKQEEVTDGLGISASEYWSNKEEYDYAYEYPEKYAIAKAVGGYEAFKTYSSELYDIKADKDSSGKSISGSRKEKVADYINNLDIDYYEKIILFKSEYNADDTYNYEIIDYLNGRDDISYKEMEMILKKLGFTVKSDGTIEW